jgi:hypothetical protein
MLSYDKFHRVVNGKDEEVIKKSSFITEFGAQGLSELSVLKKVFGDKRAFDVPKTFAKWKDWDYTKHWKYAGFQPEQTFDIAGVSPGKNINEFVANSQKFQARLLQHEIEYLRQHKWDKEKPNTGEFAFTFADPWRNAASWAVVDYERRPKLGYYAVQQANQEILPSIKYEWEKPDSPVEIVLINDKEESLKDLNLKWQVGDGEIKSQEIKELKADSVQSVVNLGILPEVVKGNQKLKVWLEDPNAIEPKKKIISENSMNDWPDINVNAPSPKLTEAQEIAAFRQDVDKIYKKSLQFFIDGGVNPKTGQVLDRIPNADLPPYGYTAKYSSVTASGFRLTNLMLAVEEGLISKEKAGQEVLKTINFLDKHNPKENKGWFAHFIDADTGEIFKNGNGASEIATIDTSEFFFNALAAGEYFGGEVKKKVEEMYNKIDFNFMLTNNGRKPDKKSFSFGFKYTTDDQGNLSYKFLDENDKGEIVPGGGVDGYSEGTLVPMLALGSKQFSDAKAKELWEKGWERTNNFTYKVDGKDISPISHREATLFMWMYPNALINMKDQVDSTGINYWDEMKKATQIDIAFAKDHGYPSYGFSACDNPKDGYSALKPLDAETAKRFKDNAQKNNKNGGIPWDLGLHSGSTAPPIMYASAALGPFAEKAAAHAHQYLKNETDNFGEKVLDQKYGVPCGRTVKGDQEGWSAFEALGIDLGSMNIMLDIYKKQRDGKQGLIHEYSDKSPIIQRIKQQAGFKPDASIKE